MLEAFHFLRDVEFLAADALQLGDSATQTLTVRNIDGWYPAFNVKPGQKLYLAPDKRVKIWG